MNFRDWLIIIGLIVISGLIADALRRLWFRRCFKNRITFGLQSIKGTDDDFLSELPNGGARIRKDRASMDKMERPVIMDERIESAGGLAGVGRTQRIAPTFADNDVYHENEEIYMKQHGAGVQGVAVNKVTPQWSMVEQYDSEVQRQQCLDEMPLQMAPAAGSIASVDRWSSHNDSVINNDSVIDNSSVITQQDMNNSLSAQNEFSVQRHCEEDKAADESHHDEYDDDPHNFSERYSESYDGDGEEERPVYINDDNKHFMLENSCGYEEECNYTDNDYEESEPEYAEPGYSEPAYIGTLDERDFTQESSPFVSGQMLDDCNMNLDNKEKQSVIKRQPQEMIVIHVEAKDKPFSGDQVLQIMMDNGLRYGDMDIFHCVRNGSYQEKDILFSVANGKEPGNFDLTNMREKTFSVLSFFMPLPGPEHPLEAFKTMIDTVDIVSRHLFAEVFDDQHCVMTLQMLEYYRQCIAEFQHRQMIELQTG